MKKTLNKLKNSIIALMLTAFAISTFGLTAQADTVAPNWNVSGTYVVALNYQGTDYSHDMSLTQDSSGNLTGQGGYPSGGTHTSDWQLTSGSISGDAISFSTNYIDPADAVTPQTVMQVTGTINKDDGSMSGTWSDNYQGNARTGTWKTTSGAAVAIAAPLPPANNVNVATESATAITSSDATLNGMNGSTSASDHSFWVSLSSFSTASPSVPANVYSTSNFGAIAENSSFSASLSSIAGLGAITPNTTYYFAAWSDVGGTWYPGKILTLTTAGATDGGTDGTVNGTVSGGASEGVLKVTSVQTMNGNAVADGTFANGFKYLFNITLPANETNLSMKLGDWTINGGSSTIPAANNLRISSPQADNNGATIPITAADTYSAPLHITGDLDPSTDGLQVQVLVEAAIPLNSMNGTYSTTYGVQTQ